MTLRNCVDASIGNHMKSKLNQKWNRIDAIYYSDKQISLGDIANHIVRLSIDVITNVTLAVSSSDGQLRAALYT